MDLKVCDYCGCELPHGEPCCTLTMANYDGEGYKAVAHYCVEPYPCARKAGETLVMLRELGDELEQVPVASPQKIAALRRKHRKG